MAKLTAKKRKGLKKKSFALPSKRAYPIHDISHARNALSRSSGKPEASTVRKKVYAKYPSLKPGKAKSKRRKK